MTPDPTISKASGTTIQSVARGARLLLLAASSRSGVSAKEAAAALGLGKPTTYHLLSTLVAEGLLEKRPGGRYALGPKAAVIATAVMRDQTAPDGYLTALQTLADETTETAYLSAWRNGSVAVLSVVEGAQALRVAGLGPGSVGGEYARATGKLLMAFADPARRAPILQTRPLEPRTPNTVTEVAELEKQFDQIRSVGYAIEDEEFAVGVSCVSAPIRENDTVVAAITVSAPAERFKQRRQELINAVLAAAERASQRPGS